MTAQGHNKTSTRLLLVAIAIGFISLVLPWWTFILSVNGRISTFDLFLWGIIKTGFTRASLPFEWWSYTTFALVALGAFLGLAGYWSLANDKNNGKKLVFLEVILTTSGYLLYLGGLLFTFTTPFHGIQDYWMTAPPDTVYVVKLNVFLIHYSNVLSIAAYEFLSLGFFLAVISSMLSLVVLYRLRKTPQMVLK
jgi:hypothetical protein